jgi:type IV pilus assembly protein PilA
MSVGLRFQGESIGSQFIDIYGAVSNREDSVMETKNTPRLVRALRAAHDHKRGRTELGGAEAGFTLIELMVVLLIMAILLAIAIPTFLGVKSGAYDRSTQSNLTNALTSAKAGYAGGGAYGTTGALEVATLTSAEPNLNFVATAATLGGNSVSVAVSTDGQELMLVGYSQSGTCWAAEDNEGLVAVGNVTTGGHTATGDYYGHWSEGTGATCLASAVSVPTSGAGSWSSHY